MASTSSIFETAASGEELANLLQSLTEPEQLSLEQTSVSCYSPGVILEDERLIRALDQPVHFVDGEFSPTAFFDAQIRGLSVNRLSHISLSDVVQLAQNRVARVNQKKVLASVAEAGETPPAIRKAVGYVILSTTDLRNVRWRANGPERRVFGVYDTAKADDPSHGDVFFLIAGKHAWRSAREALYQLAKRTLVTL